MAESRAAHRYVRSLLELSVEKGVLDAVHQDMLVIQKVCNSNRDFLMMLKSPLIRHERKREILTRMFSGKVNELTKSILDILTRKNRESLIPAIASGFHEAFNEYKGIGHATVSVAVPMDQQLRATLESIVKRLSDRKSVEIEEKVDDSLIGGFVLNVGDRQIDASIKNKLKLLSIKLKEN
ncbi:MAG: ATP synthase F1 subunit delta [Bacteroidetes bacterium]|nr:ATP synthase F1 subunit delta [Bacteroidota bacterium]MBS1975792.1 ATP synthase F1 subunit delta [Bacteroidota bacterium]